MRPENRTRYSESEKIRIFYTEDNNRFVLCIDVDEKIVTIFKNGDSISQWKIRQVDIENLKRCHYIDIAYTYLIRNCYCL